MAFWRRRRHGDFADEIEAHLRLDADQLTADGAPPDEARAAARRRFGNVTAARERFYESRRLPAADRLLHDVRGAVRALRRHPIVSIVAVVSLAAGIGSASASLVVRDTIFRNPPPLYEKPGDLTTVFTVTPRGFRRGVPAGLLETWRREPVTDRAWAAARSPRRDDVRAGDSVGTASVRAVTTNLFPLLGVRAAIGRTFDASPEDASSAVVLSYRVWQTLLDSRSDVVGSTLWIGERTYTVIGVMPQRFWFTDIDAFVWTVFDAQSLPPDETLEVVVRRSPSLAPTALRDSLAGGLASYVNRLPADRRALRVSVEGIGGTPMGHAMSLLFPYLLGGCVVLTWLIACANVAILMMAQWTAREHEIGILASLGANRARIVRLLLTEAALIALAGGGLGVAATFAIRRFILLNAPSLALFDTSLHVDFMVEAVLITVITAMLIGLAPALYETRRLHANPLAPMASDRTRQRWRHALVIAEIAGTVALLVVTGTMIDAYRRTMSAELGFATHALLGVSVENPKGIATREILDLMSGQPGVVSVAAATSAPLMGAPDLRSVALESGAGAVAVQAEPVRVSPAFFSTIGVPMRAGRPFDGADTPAAPGAAIVSESLASRLLPGRSAVGAHVRLDGRVYTIVGVVADYHRFPLSVPPPALYLPLEAASAGTTRLQFMLRTPVAAGPLFETLRREVRRVGAGHTVTATHVVDQVIEVSGQELLAGTFPLVPLITIGLVLTAAGVYAVLAFAVTRRSKELALRIAIGATARDVLGVVTAHSVRLVAVGTALGIAVTFALSRVVRAMGGAGSYLDTPAWPAFVIPALIIVAVSALATWIPSRRALTLDPATLLRVE